MKAAKKVALAALAAAAMGAFAEEVDGIAARVGSAVVLKSDVVGEMRRSGVGPGEFAAVRDALVDRQLMLKAATDAKLQMQDWVVENRVREIVSDVFGGDMNNLKSALAKDRVSYPEWRQRLKEDMIVRAIRWQVVDKNVSATPAAMRAEYAAHPERYRAERRVTVSAVLLSPDDAGKKAEVDKALKAEPFADVARRYSADAHAKDGGQWKDVRPEEVFRPEICTVLDALKTGETSKWVELDGWNFLVRKDEESGGRARSFADAYDAVAENVRAAEAKRLYDAWIKRLRAAAYVKVY